MEIDNILLLRTIILLLPYFAVFAFFYYRIRDQFFLKPRTHIQLNIMMICLVIVFLELVYWNLSLREYVLMGFSLSKNAGTSETSNTILVLLGIVAAILGWLFPARGQALTATRNHSIQTLMESRLSDAYTRQVELCTEVLVKFKKEKGESYNLTTDDFNTLDQKYKNAIFYLLNYLEFVSVGVRFNDLDENLMRNMMKSIINANFTFFGEIIKDKQTKTPSIYEHLTALQKRWSCFK
ncbi:DUF4760 domain-containing protein [Acinetobacter calcoaceticus]|uniref:DUF4760 domain-containing protein n=1 Tax=Acinetobacter calcoaceticus TaxID=471 RepID=UPI0009AD21E5|nr:DUF4760 domain-containing protein [Acinetobacter calcoaceticus]AQZ81200.1 DUF4760 domain-containing protein [Acinetobacter calcoaceticus]